MRTGALLAIAAFLLQEAPPDPAARVDAAIREARAVGGTHFRVADGIAALGAPAVEPLERIVLDRGRGEADRILAVRALGRIPGAASLAAVRGALAAPALPEGLRGPLEESAFLLGDRDPIEERIAMLATRHRDLPVVAPGARRRLAQTYAETGRFRLAWKIQWESVLAEREARPESARFHAYNAVCWAALGGDRAAAIEAARLTVESDRTDLDWMARDGDLASLREDPEFRALLDGARAKRAPAADPGDAARKAHPLYGEYRELADGFWDGAHDAYIEAHNSYWERYSAWLVEEGEVSGPEPLAAWAVKAGPAPVDPTPAWVPRFRTLLAKAEGSVLEPEVRGNLLSMFGNTEQHGPWVDVFLESLDADPDPRPGGGRSAGEALYFAERAGRAEEVRARMLEVVKARPDDAGTAEFRLALAVHASGAGRAEEARAGFAEVLRRHPGTRAAEEAEGRLYEIEKLAPGVPAPEFEAVDIRGIPVSLKALRGRVVVLDFWASWCGPCMGEVPALREMEEALREKGVVVLGISLDEDGWDLAECLEREKMGWRQVCDLGGFDGAIPRLYRVRGIPRTVVVDREGRIAGMDLRGENLRAAVERLLK